jgi:hypothetical protein
MIKFKIEEKEYNVPDFVSIDNYVKIYKIKDFFDDDYFTVKLISMFTGAPIDDLSNSDYSDISYIAAYILSLLPQGKQDFKDRFEIDGVKYGFFRKWQDLTFAEFVDMDTISTKKPNDLLNMLHVLAAIMYRPITEERSEHDFDIEKYDVKTMVKRSELFKQKLDVKYILGAQFFFIKFAKRYLSYSQASLIQKIPIWTRIKLYWKMRKIMWKLAFNPSSVGSLSSTELLQMILQNTNKSIKKT